MTPCLVKPGARLGFTGRLSVTERDHAPLPEPQVQGGNEHPDHRRGVGAQAHIWPGSH